MSATTAPPRQRSRIASLLGWIALGLVCLVAAGTLAMHAVGWQPLTVLSGSMAPSLRAGDLILVAPTRARAMEVGDVVTFARPGSPGETLTHRVVGLRHGGRVPAGWVDVTTRGDANPVPERWSVPLDATVGALRVRIPHLGEAAAPLRGEISRGLGAVAVIALLAAVVLWAIWRPRGGGVA